MGKKSAVASRELIDKAKHEFDKVAKKAEKALTDKKTAKHIKILDHMERSGTLGDRVGALMMKIQKSREISDFADFNSLDQLISMAQKKNRRETEMTLDALKELFIEHLLPNHAIQYLDKSVKGASPDLKRLVFEDKLKHKYSDFLHVLIDKAQDTVAHFKKLMIKFLVELAECKAEARDFILDAVLNKLGDKDVSIPTSIVVEMTHAIRVI